MGKWTWYMCAKTLSRSRYISFTCPGKFGGKSRPGVVVARERRTYREGRVRNTDIMWKGEGLCLPDFVGNTVSSLTRFCAQDMTRSIYVGAGSRNCFRLLSIHKMSRLGERASMSYTWSSHLKRFTHWGPTAMVGHVCAVQNSENTP